ncbi:MAG: cell envelope integrity protein TolA [Mizugakiibacter sp.]|uniref:cell envelope integrity protein TolA n=1 Tax=Mizugakiibacter sp. TaxID=1972610 RepID=UPI0031BC70C8|nr:cell envelope integrity protein TolA [Xanthomonadaceae bacterium]
MDEVDTTPRAVVLSALLHVGILAFLWLATLSCASWEGFFGVLHLPGWMNPVTCAKPVALPGPVIEATLVGPAGAPPPAAAKPAKVKSEPPKPSQASAPPPQVPQPTPPKPEPEPVKVLPPPPKQPDVKDQEKVVAEAQQKAEQEKKEQEERERMRQAELEAQQQKARELIKQLEEIKQQRLAAERKSKLEQQRLQQLADLKKEQAKQSTRDAAATDATVPEAAQARSGMAGQDNSLSAQYQAALISVITQNWLRPDNIPKGAVCPIHIVQIPGGEVISARVDPSCPYDDLGRRSVENAVGKASPLPYKGFENVFSRDVTLNFTVQD